MYNSHHGTATSTVSSTPVRSRTPENDAITPVGRMNPFATPYGSMPASAVGSTTGLEHVPQARYFHSRRVKKGEVEKPWTVKKDPKEKWVTIIPIIGIVVGLIVSGILIWDGLQSVTNHVYCPVLDEDFSGGLNSKVWTKEVEVGGFG